MRKKTFLLSIGACLIFASECFSWPWSKNFDLPALARASRPAVVLIILFDSSNETVGSGTGFFISADGTLVTNGHVVELGTKAIAKTEDGRSFPILGVLANDPIDDLVLLKVEGGKFPFLRLGDSNSTDLPVGERVAVIGSPLGLEGSVSDGVVSAFRPSKPDGNLIQITAAVSPGSSGSPVLNSSGEVVGIATLVLTGGQSLNFAIPSVAVKGLSSAAARNRVEPFETFVLGLRTAFPRNDENYNSYRRAYEARDWQGL